MAGELMVGSCWVAKVCRLPRPLRALFRELLVRLSTHHTIIINIQQIINFHPIPSYADFCSPSAVVTVHPPPHLIKYQHIIISPRPTTPSTLYPYNVLASLHHPSSISTPGSTPHHSFERDTSLQYRDHFPYGSMQHQHHHARLCITA